MVGSFCRGDLQVQPLAGSGESRDPIGGVAFVRCGQSSAPCPLASIQGLLKIRSFGSTFQVKISDQAGLITAGLGNCWA